jgi:hypothetical protein
MKKGEKMSEAQKKLRSKRMRGKNNPMFGKKGSSSTNWKGGKTYSLTRKKYTYIMIYNPQHPFASPRGYVYEHRLIMEAHLKRFLLSTEIVHHLNNITTDNRIENLVLLPNPKAHKAFHRRHDG